MDGNGNVMVCEVCEVREENNVIAESEIMLFCNDFNIDKSADYINATDSNDFNDNNQPTIINL